MQSQRKIRVLTFEVPAVAPVGDKTKKVGTRSAR